MDLMCGRYALHVRGEELAEAFEDEIQDIRIPPEFPWPPRYNLCPTQAAPVLLLDVGTPRFALHRWGLVPAWAREARIGVQAINARSETLTEKPMFRAAFKSRRCVVPASGYFEWKAAGGTKTPHYVHPRGGRPLLFAGLWESHAGFEGAGPLLTFSIVTCPPNAMMATIHDRMPVVLRAGAARRWIDPTTPAADLATMMVPAANDLLDAYPVGAGVGNVRSDGPELIKRVEAQRTLFG